MRVRVRSDSSDKLYQGQIGFISPRAEFTPKTVETTDLRTALVYRLRIVVTNADAALRQGMPVTIEVVVGYTPGARAKERCRAPRHPATDPKCTCPGRQLHVEIGRAICRVRVWESVYITIVAVAIKKTN